MTVNFINSVSVGILSKLYKEAIYSAEMSPVRAY